MECITEEYKRKMTKIIFSDKAVLSQLNDSKLEPEGNDIESIDDYSRFMKEMGNER